MFSVQHQPQIGLPMKNIAIDWVAAAPSDMRRLESATRLLLFFCLWTCRISNIQTDWKEMHLLARPAGAQPICTREKQVGLRWSCDAFRRLSRFVLIPLAERIL